MITLRKENRIVKVSDNEVEKYIGKGYTRVEVEQSAPLKPQPVPKTEEKNLFGATEVEPVKVKATKAKRTNRK